jgi:predicted porin
MYVGGLEWDLFNNNNTLMTQIFYGRNQPEGGGAKYSGSNYYGIDITAKHKLTSKVGLLGGAVYQYSLYDEKELVDGPRRRDRYFSYSAGVYYRFHPNLTWYVNGAYTNCHSTLFTYQYDRFEALTGIGFEL